MHSEARLQGNLNQINLCFPFLSAVQPGTIWHKVFGACWPRAKNLGAKQRRGNGRQKRHCRAKRKEAALFWAGFVALSNAGPRCKHVFQANAFEYSKTVAPALSSTQRDGTPG